MIDSPEWNAYNDKVFNRAKWPSQSVLKRDGQRTMAQTRSEVANRKRALIGKQKEFTFIEAVEGFYYSVVDETYYRCGVIRTKYGKNTNYVVIG